MTKMKSLVLVLLTVAFAASISFAQRHEGPPDPATMVQHHVQHLTNALSLTPAQQQQATTIFTNNMTGAASIHNDMKTAHQNLQTAINNNDENGISQAATTIGNLTAQMIASHAKAQAAFRQILTPEQQTKLSQMESEYHGMGMGFGGPEMGHFRHN
jgi:Spy/CpxP family protein refolding chaperone